MAHAQEQSLQQQRDSMPKLISDLSFIPIYVLQALDAMPFATDAALAARLKLSEPTIVQAIMMLWDEGLVTALTSHDDGEPPQYQTNEKGRQLLAQYHDLHQRAQSQYGLFFKSV